MHTIQEEKISSKEQQPITRKHLLLPLTMSIVLTAAFIFLVYFTQARQVSEKTGLLSAQALSQLASARVVSMHLAASALPSKTRTPYVAEAKFTLAQAIKAGQERMVIARSDGTIELQNSATGKTQNTFQSDPGISDAALSADGKLASVSNSGFLRIWDTNTGKLIHTYTHRTAIRGASWSSDGQFLATGSNDGSVRIWDAQTEENTIVYKHESSIVAVEFSSTGELLSASDDGYIRVSRDVQGFDQELMHEFVSRWLDMRPVPLRYKINSARFSPDGRSLIIGSEDGIVCIVDKITGEKVGWVNHGAAVTEAIFNKDSSKIITAGIDGLVRIWDSKTFRLIDTIANSVHVTAMAISSDGSLAIGDQRGNVQVWNLHSMKKFRKYHDLKNPVQYLLFDQENEYILIGIDVNGLKYSWDLHSQWLQILLWALMILPILIMLILGLWIFPDVRNKGSSDLPALSLEKKMRLLLMMYPESYRQEVGEDLLFVTACQYQDAYNSSGAPGFINIFIQSLSSMTVNAIQVHVADAWEQISAKISD